MGNTGYIFRLGDASLFSVAAMSGEDAARIAQDAKWSVLTQKGDVIYACRVETAGVSNGLSVDSLREYVPVHPRGLEDRRDLMQKGAEI